MDVPYFDANSEIINNVKSIGKNPFDNVSDYIDPPKNLSIKKYDPGYVARFLNLVKENYIWGRKSRAVKKISNKKYLSNHEGKELLEGWVNNGVFNAWKGAHKAIKRERRRNLVRKITKAA